MRSFWLFVLIFVGTASWGQELTVATYAPAPFVLLSDLDDTIKITNVLSWKKYWKGAFGGTSFVGMQELYRALLHPEGRSIGNEFVVVSGSPRFLLSRVVDFLLDQGFPSAQVFLKEKTFEPVESFKRRVISETLSQSSGPFLLVGDDTEKDPEVYAEMTAAYGSRVLAVYIRHLTGIPLPEPEFVSFLSAFDLALSEWRAGRLSEEGVRRVAVAILNESDDERVIPSFSDCPTSWHNPICPKAIGRPQIQNACRSVESRLMNICLRR